MFHMPMSSPHKTRMFGCFTAIRFCSFFYSFSSKSFWWMMSSVAAMEAMIPEFRVHFSSFRKHSRGYTRARGYRVARHDLRPVVPDGEHAEDKRNRHRDQRGGKEGVPLVRQRDQR